MEGKAQHGKGGVWRKKHSDDKNDGGMKGISGLRPMGTDRRVTARSKQENGK